jgi:hypothetical protein
MAATKRHALWGLSPQAKARAAVSPARHPTRQRESGSEDPLLRWKSKKTKDIRLLRTRLPSGCSRTGNGIRLWSTQAAAADMDSF